MNKWCEFCQEHFSEDHFDSNEEHKIGIEFGQTGKELYAMQLLKEAHDKMDDKNAEFDGGRTFCIWCDDSMPHPGHSSYDAQGIFHKDDCILVKIRKVIVT